MALMTKQQVIDTVKVELTASVVNLELSDAIITNNIDRALMLSTDYWSYTDFKTLDITTTDGGSGYIELKDIDEDNKTPAIINVYPTNTVMRTQGNLLGLGTFIMKGSNSQHWRNQMLAYGNMVNQMSQLESILNRGAKVVGDKLMVDNFYTSVTIEYIPNVVKVDNINEGSWLEWIIDYATALSKRQIAQSRGKYSVSSNPFETNAVDLLENSNAMIEDLKARLENKGILTMTR